MTPPSDGRPPIPGYGRQLIDEDDVRAVSEALRSGWLTTGPEVEAFEGELAERADAAHAVVVSSGTAALHAAYFALGLGPGDRILTSPLTFASTATAALHLGAGVIFCDVDPGTGNLDPMAAAAAVSDGVRAVVAVDYAGHPADYPALRALPQDLPLVVDGAHSLGALREGHSPARHAELVCTSLHPVKAITSAEGGVIFARDAALAERCRRFRNHGIERDPERWKLPGGAGYYEVQELGLNYRLPDVLCALGRSQLRKLDAFLARRREIAARYLAELGAIDALELPAREEGVESAWHLFVLRVREGSRRDAFADALRERGLGSAVHYPPVHLHPLFRDLGHRPGECPIAEDFAARALSIPFYPALADEQVEQVIEAVAGAAEAVL